MSTIIRSTCSADFSNRQQAEALDRLSRVSTFIEYAYPDHAPFDFQRTYHDNFYRWLWLESARQVGKSSMMSHNEIMLCMALPKHKSIFCSYTLDDCKEKIEYANDLYNELRDCASLRPFVSEKVVDNKLELKFANGSRFLSVFSPRGKAKANVRLDEFAHVPNPRKVYRAATPIIHAGGSLHVMSTTTHSRTMFARMGRREGGKFGDFVRARIFWWDCPIHCRDVPAARVKAPTMSPEERVYKFGTAYLIEQFENNFLEDFLREFELTETDDETAFLPWDLIMKCTPTEEGEVEKMKTLAELRSKTKGRLFGGFDVGRRIDAAELSVFCIEGGVAVERYHKQFKRKAGKAETEIDFDAQEKELIEFMKLTRVMRLEIDETGMGMMLAERLKKRFGHRVVPVSFTNDNKAMRAGNMRMLMETNKARYLADMNANFQMHSVKKDISRSGNVILVVKNEEGASGEHHHADRFWARALALHAWQDITALGKPRIGWA